MRFAWLSLVPLLLGCTSPRATAVESAPVKRIDRKVSRREAMFSELGVITPSRRSRRGECRLDDALNDFIGGEKAVRCDDPTMWPNPADSASSRACILAAAGARKAFTATWSFPSFDSSLKHAYAGRNTGKGYELRRFSYDSCRGGCGDDDPVWSSVTCNALVDMRAACASRNKVEAVEADTEFPSACGEDISGAWTFDIWCVHPVDANRCPHEG
jgi:hypothetical protein